MTVNSFGHDLSQVAVVNIRTQENDWIKAFFAVSSIRILVVEDFAPFRKSICSTLGERADLQVICEVADELDAVQKAEELKFDLILLDIGHPTLNGIEAARHICKPCPSVQDNFSDSRVFCGHGEKGSQLGSVRLRSEGAGRN
jgi:response regulator receiver domain-containing protein